MPNIDSAKKRMRQNEKRRLQNRYRKSTVRTFEKKIYKAIETGNIENAESAYISYSSNIDKAAKTNLIHPKTASRKKSRLSHFIKKAKES